MRIIFDLRNVGLGNQGGSSTLVKCGNTLVEMGHDIFFIDSMKNQHTWTPLEAEHIICEKEKHLPDADVIIATGYKSVKSTVSAPSRCGLKAHYIRAWETWQMQERDIVKKVLEVPTLKIVNSDCLQKKLRDFSFTSHIIRPGYDFEDLYPLNIRGKKDEIIIGGLFREGVHGRRKRTMWLFETARALKTRHKNVKFWLFGSESAPAAFLVNHYVRSPYKKQKNEFYNMVDIWMAPTMLEGLHLPPAEAMLTECTIISTNAELSGTQDYITNGITGLVSDNNIDSFISNVKWLVVNPKIRKELGKNGRQRILEIGDRKHNMQKMIDLFTGIIDDNS